MTNDNHPRLHCDFTMIRIALAVFVVALGLPCIAADRPGKPNIVVILADDLGYGDVACYNRERGKIPTPHIDKLAAEGMRFTNAHSSSAVCSPSRYSLLTGRYHWRTRLQQGIVPVWGKPPGPADHCRADEKVRLPHRVHR
jgi:arylsulfatase A